MKDFDNEIEKAVNRAGKAAGWMFVLGVMTLVFGLFGGSAAAEDGGGGEAFLTSFVFTLPAAGLLFGMGVVINLLGMHLMETWRQGRRSEAANDR